MAALDYTKGILQVHLITVYFFRVLQQLLTMCDAHTGRAVRRRAGPRRRDAASVCLHRVSTSLQPHARLCSNPRQVLCITFPETNLALL